MATCGRPGGGGGKEINPGNVGRDERLEGGSWIATSKGGRGSMVKL